jgi:hypothetical protein
LKPKLSQGVFDVLQSKRFDDCFYFFHGR